MSRRAARPGAELGRADRDGRSVGPAGRKALTSPDVLEAFERSVAAEEALESLLEERRSWWEQMREAIGGR
jgi:hypothetical protein